MANFVAVRYDAERGEGRAMAQRYGVDGFPGFVVLDANGRLIDKFAGFYSPEDIINRLRSSRRG